MRSFLIDVESADRQAAHMSLWTCDGKIHPRGLSTGCRAWRGRSACCGRMSRCPALSRAFRLIGLRRGLGLGVGTLCGRRTPLPAADRRRAGHRPRGKPNLGVEGHLARDLRQPDSPHRPGLSRTRRHRDQLIAAGQAAEQQPCSHAWNKWNGPERTGTGATQVRRPGASRSTEFRNLPEEMRPRERRGR
jgi:hypothetical protein